MSNASSAQRLLVVLGNQLFPVAHVRELGVDRVFMAEDRGLCTYVKHHKLKLVLFLSAMRSYADELRDAGLAVHYAKLDDQPDSAKAPSYEQKLGDYLDDHKAIDTLVHFEIEDKFFEHRLATFAGKRGLDTDERPSPMFFTSRQRFAEYLDDSNGKPFMARFYQQQRKRMCILVDDDAKPVGGKWSFDAENRKKLPKKITIPETKYAAPTDHVKDVVELVNDRFADHPGTIDGLASIWFPTTRRQALWWFREFLDKRFDLFGDYEDALSSRGDWLFHSVLSPMINLGLLTPDEIVERALEHAEENDIPLNALEGFVRQIIGWREFIRGIYQNYSSEQEEKNAFDNHRTMNDKWYTGQTGMPPLDDAIEKALRLGWTHHIERLMVVSNFMNLCEIQPKQAHDWFMQMFVDSSDWVMGPNVYGMGLCSDGGIFSTKPYVCGSNYLKKMSDQYGQGDWCEVADGLYWRFIDKHRTFFESNPRMAVMTKNLDKMDGERKHRIFTKAGRFISDVTEDG
ncbi:MAG: cryptochrome/photolyase family protein [Phycisphaeraceae bacterium]